MKDIGERRYKVSGTVKFCSSDELVYDNKAQVEEDFRKKIYLEMGGLNMSQTDLIDIKIEDLGPIYRDEKENPVLADGKLLWPK